MHITQITANIHMLHTSLFFAWLFVVIPFLPLINGIEISAKITTGIRNINRFIFLPSKF